MYEGQKQNFKSNVWKAFTQVHDPKLSSHCLQEMSWIFAFELVGRDFLNLDRPCSRHCLCPEHRPLLSCSRHCEQVNVILSFANFEELLLNQGPENNNSETTGRWARGCCWNPHQVRHKTGERQLSQVGQMFWYFVEFVQNQKLLMDLFRLASLRIMVVQFGGWVLTNPMVAPLQKHQNGIHKWKRLFT